MESINKASPSLGQELLKASQHTRIFYNSKLVLESSAQENEVRCAQKAIHVLARLLESAQVQQDIKTNWPFYLDESGEPAKQLGRLIS
jgi:hypothetical protein